GSAATTSGHVARRDSQGGNMSKVSEKLKMAAEKGRAVLAAIGAIEKQFGKGAIMRLGEGEIGQPVATFPSGSLGLDLALGCGGYPRGRVIEIFGPESSGKTTLTLHAIAQVQAQGGCAAFIDAEHALDVTYARRLGVKVEDLLISQPDTGEQALEITETLVRSGAVDLVVIDSVAALPGGGVRRALRRGELPAARAARARGRAGTDREERRLVRDRRGADRAGARESSGGAAGESRGGGDARAEGARSRHRRQEVA